MKRLPLFVLLTILLFSCQNTIKNDSSQVIEEEGTAVQKQLNHASRSSKDHALTTLSIHKPLLGYWVGYFEKDMDKNQHSGEALFLDEGYYWNRANKINLSIDAIIGDTVTGHSVVSGNDRPFIGTIKSTSPGSFQIDVKEPGDDYYDGKFSFTIKNDTLFGTWSAYKNIDIKHRKYTLQKRTFKYDPNVNLDYAKRFVDWKDYKERIDSLEYEEHEFDVWIQKSFSTATEHIYQINASNTLLTKAIVENLKKGDLVIIRNTIYARHGYSFKNRPLRVFFDAQDWYIPVHADIKSDFTEIEKKNIELLLKYEENATVYYDTFGRG